MIFKGLFFKMSLPNVINNINDLEVIKANKDDVLPLSGGIINGDISFSGSYNLKHTVDNSLVRVQGGSEEGKGGRLVLSGMNRSSNPGCCELVATDGTISSVAMFRPNGVFTWRGKNVTTSVNGKTADTSGNVSIPPFKLFSETGCKTLADLPEGFYYVRGDAELSPSDKPVSNWGMIIVCYNGGTPFQIYEVDNSTNRYKRWCSSGVWSAWNLA